MKEGRKKNTPTDRKYLCGGGIGARRGGMCNHNRGSTISIHVRLAAIVPRKGRSSSEHERKGHAWAAAKK